MRVPCAVLSPHIICPVPPPPPPPPHPNPTHPPTRPLEPHLACVAMCTTSTLPQPSTLGTSPGASSASGRDAAASWGAGGATPGSRHLASPSFKNPLLAWKAATTPALYRWVKQQSCSHSNSSAHRAAPLCRARWPWPAGARWPCLTAGEPGCSRPAACLRSGALLGWLHAAAWRPAPPHLP